MTNYDRDPTEEQRSEWNKEQERIREQLLLHDMITFNADTLGNLKYVAGVDLSFPLDDFENAIACLVVMEFPRFLPTKLHLPYISGYLAFREVNPLLFLLNQLKKEEPHLYPQVILVDGNGLLHPRRFGIACHLGVLSNTPTVGVAKNFLVIPSEFDDMHSIKSACKKVLLRRGDVYNLIGNTSQLCYGAAVKTSEAASNPVYISQGHRISLQTAIKVVLATSPKYRVPEPIRAADCLSRAYIRENSSV
ncbi:Endonuclease V [Choanephora cucurbitarum]|uniref:Endonuclease V n=1 Tax=Choanephora cucurbitarum TaxID=101091 RepID=A0A1C7NSJ1_9FUNG|nr:Endonuclease V [Choanephora cucurbitarum]